MELKRIIARDGRSASSCGTGLYGTESRRRVMSIPVRFIYLPPNLNPSN